MGPRTKRLPSAQASVSVSGPAAIPEVLRTLGSDPAVVLAEAGIDPALFADPENQIPLATLGRLVKLCVARTGCRHFGLLVGQQGGLHSLGLVGLLARLSPDVGTALRRLADCMPLHHGGTLTAVAVDGDAATLSYDIDQRYDEAADQIGDGSRTPGCSTRCPRPVPSPGSFSRGRSPGLRPGTATTFRSRSAACCGRR